MTPTMNANDCLRFCNGIQVLAASQVDLGDIFEPLILIVRRSRPGVNRLQDSRVALEEIQRYAALRAAHPWLTCGSSFSAYLCAAAVSALMLFPALPASSARLPGSSTDGLSSRRHEVPLRPHHRSNVVRQRRGAGSVCTAERRPRAGGGVSSRLRDEGVRACCGGGVLAMDQATSRLRPGHRRPAQTQLDILPGALARWSGLVWLP